MGHGAPVQQFAFCLFSVPADPICGAPLKKEMETKYPDKWQEKRRAKPVCFVSRNQKRPRRHFYCFLETKHAKNPGLFPMFPFSCVSTSTLTTGTAGTVLPNIDPLIFSLQLEFLHTVERLSKTSTPAYTTPQLESSEGERQPLVQERVFVTIQAHLWCRW